MDGVTTVLLLAGLGLLGAELPCGGREGALFFLYYVAYTAYLVLESQRHDALPAFSHTMQLFVIPLTVITLAVVATRSARERKPGPPSS